MSLIEVQIMTCAVNINMETKGFVLVRLQPRLKTNKKANKPEMMQRGAAVTCVANERRLRHRRVPTRCYLAPSLCGFCRP